MSQNRCPLIGSPGECGHAYRCIRRQFYEDLSGIVDMPTRISMQHGFAWRSTVPGIYHRLIVMPYIGCFDRPALYGWQKPIPRIHLNHFDFYGLSRAQQRRWSVDTSVQRWGASRGRLELTVTIEQLLDFVRWVAIWARAHDSTDPGMIPWPPHPLEGPTHSLGFTSYLWTTAADEEYLRYRSAQPRRRSS